MLWCALIIVKYLQHNLKKTRLRNEGKIEGYYCLSQILSTKSMKTFYKILTYIKQVYTHKIILLFTSIFPCRNIFLRTCHIVCDDEPAHEDDTRSQMQANVFELTNVFVYP